MDNVVSLADYKIDKIANKIKGLVDIIREGAQGTYDIIAPLGFKTRRRIPTPIAKMNLEQLDRFNEEMAVWIYKNCPEMLVEQG
jgi:hypothetical protein